MTQTKLEQIIGNQLDACAIERAKKNPDYAEPDDGDTLSNFRETGYRADVSPLQAWLTHFTKHVIAIEKYCANGGHLKSEKIEGRITDAINYLLLLRALIEQPAEEEKEEALLEAEARSLGYTEDKKPSILASILGIGK